MKYISDNINNKASTLKEAIIIASSDYNAVITKMKLLEQEKDKKEEPKKDGKVDVQDLKDNVQKIIIKDFDGR